MSKRDILSVPFARIERAETCTVVPPVPVTAQSSALSAHAFCALFKSPLRGNIILELLIIGLKI